VCVVVVVGGGCFTLGSCVWSVYLIAVLLLVCVWGEVSGLCVCQDLSAAASQPLYCMGGGKR